jgi:hypothetical protein
MKAIEMLEIVAAAIADLPMVRRTSWLRLLLLMLKFVHTSSNGSDRSKKISTRSRRLFSRMPNKWLVGGDS